MGLDIISLVHAILSLLKLLYKIRHAAEERNFLLKTLEDTTLLHTRVNSNFRSLGYRISKDEREWINSILTHSELALTEAREVISDAGSKHKKLRRPFRSLRWVLEGKEAATMHMGENLQHHLALMIINFRLFMERRRYAHTCTLGGSTRPCRYPEVPQEFVSLLGSEYLGGLRFPIGTEAKTDLPHENRTPLIASTCTWQTDRSIHKWLIQSATRNAGWIIRTEPIVWLDQS